MIRSISGYYYIMKDKINIIEELIAPCGMNCAICSKYLAYINDLRFTHCKGCRTDEKNCTYLFEKCTGANHYMLNNENAFFCYECEEFPCREIERMDRRYRNNYGMSVKDNLKQINEGGMDMFLKDQYGKYRCLACDSLISIHNKKCFHCDKITKLIEKQK